MCKGAICCVSESLVLNCCVALFDQAVPVKGDKLVTLGYMRAPAIYFSS